MLGPFSGSRDRPSLHPLRAKTLLTLLEQSLSGREDASNLLDDAVLLYLEGFATADLVQMVVRCTEEVSKVCKRLHERNELKF